MKIYLNALTAIQFDRRIERAVIMHALTVETSLLKVSGGYFMPFGPRSHHTTYTIEFYVASSAYAVPAAI